MINEVALLRLRCKALSSCLTVHLLASTASPPVRHSTCLLYIHFFSHIPGPGIYILLGVLLPLKHLSKSAQFVLTTNFTIN